jgi:shikimate kinase
VKKNIALTGFMAVGKSAVGRALARRLRLRFVDLDRTIEKSEGMKVRDIFSRKGEPYFRKLEKQALAEILLKDDQVIATGGGVVMDEENLRLLRDRSVLVCLTASADVLLKRTGNGNKRPLLKGENRKELIEELLKQREKSYSQSHIAIDTSNLNIDQVTERIIELLNTELPECKA